MKVKVIDFSIQKETISSDNVLAMAEIIAFTETRYLIAYMGSRMQKLYADLYSDIKNKHNRASRHIEKVLTDSKNRRLEPSIFLYDKSVLSRSNSA